MEQADAGSRGNKQEGPEAVVCTEMMTGWTLTPINTEGHILLQDRHRGNEEALHYVSKPGPRGRGRQAWSMHLVKIKEEKNSNDVMGGINRKRRQTEQSPQGLG